MLEKKVTGITQCGREITVQEIEEIKETVSMFWRLSRKELAQTIAENLQWYRASGTNIARYPLEIIYMRQGCFGQTRFDSERSIDFLDRTAFSKHDGQDYFVYMGAGHDWIIDRWTFGPTMGIEYVYLHEEGYKEHSAGAADLKIDSCNSDSLLSLLGFHVTRSFQLKKSVLIADKSFACKNRFSISHFFFRS